MARKKKNGIYVTFMLEAELVEKLNKMAQETMIPKTRLVEAALREYFKSTTSS